MEILKNFKIQKNEKNRKFILSDFKSICSVAKNETNDCAVRAYSFAFDVSYKTAHYKIKHLTNRKDKKGTSSFALRRMLNNDPNATEINILNKNERSMTVNQFLKAHPIGTFYVTVTGHAFTIIDGIVCGNSNDAVQTRKKILFAYEIKNDKSKKVEPKKVEKKTKKRRVIDTSKMTPEELKKYNDLLEYKRAYNKMRREKKNRK